MDPEAVVGSSDPYELLRYGVTIIVGALATVITVLWRKTEAHNKKIETMLDHYVTKCESCENDRMELAKKTAFLEGRLTERTNEHTSDDCGEI